MSCCGPCRGIEEQFGEATARRELDRFRRKGPPRSTALLLDLLREDGLAGAGADRAGTRRATLLDIGGGVGAIHHVLLEEGVAEATHVDASPAYLAVARAEAERRGHGGRVVFLRGDFVDLAPGIDEADVVTLDRVVCCYPDMRGLVGRSAAKARRLYALVYPRRVWWTRAMLPAGNLWLRLRRSSFRAFLHEPAAVRARVEEEGLELRVQRTTFLWRIELYGRPEAA